MRHIFTEAQHSSITNARWELSATYSDPNRLMMTEYTHKASGDRISCESFDYDELHKFTGGYKKHLFKFSQGADESNAKITGAEASGASPCWILPTENTDKP